MTGEKVVDIKPYSVTVLGQNRTRSSSFVMSQVVHGRNKHQTIRFLKKLLK